MADRRSQPRCDDCNHPRSFHGSGPCRALGCGCSTWEGLPPEAPAWMPGLTVAEVAAEHGRGQTYVKEHAEEFGGIKVPGSWLRPRQAGEVWRFDPDFEVAVPA